MPLEADLGFGSGQVDEAGDHRSAASAVGSGAVSSRALTGRYEVTLQSRREQVRATSRPHANVVQPGHRGLQRRAAVSERGGVYVKTKNQGRRPHGRALPSRWWPVAPATAVLAVVGYPADRVRADAATPRLMALGSGRYEVRFNKKKVDDRAPSWRRWRPGERARLQPFRCLHRQLVPDARTVYVETKNPGRRPQARRAVPPGGGVPVAPDPDRRRRRRTAS